MRMPTWREPLKYCRRKVSMGLMHFGNGIHPRNRLNDNRNGSGIFRKWVIPTFIAVFRKKRRAMTWHTAFPRTFTTMCERCANCGKSGQESHSAGSERNVTQDGRDMCVGCGSHWLRRILVNTGKVHLCTWPKILIYAMQCVATCWLRSSLKLLSGNWKTCKAVCFKVGLYHTMYKIHIQGNGTNNIQQKFIWIYNSYQYYFESGKY